MAKLMKKSLVGKIHKVIAPVEKTCSIYCPELNWCVGRMGIVDNVYWIKDDVEKIAIRIKFSNGTWWFPVECVDVPVPDHQLEIF